MAVTQREIAERAGVSQVLVSTTLRGLGRVSPQTRAKVIRAAEELGYRPNGAARAIQRGCFMAAALLYRPDQGPIEPLVLSGINHVLSANDMHLTLAELPLYDHQPTPKVLREMCVDGLLVYHQRAIEPQLIEQIQAQFVPAVWINTRHDCDCVYPDDRDAGQRVTQALIAAGHRRIGYFGLHDPQPERRHYSNADRHAGYTQAMQEAGLMTLSVLRDAVVHRTSQEPHHHRLRCARELLQQHPEITGWVVQDTGEALSLLLAAVEKGWSIPRDLSLVTFASNVVSANGIPLSTIKLPLLAMGGASMQMLNAKIQFPDQRQKAQVLRFEEFLGETIVAPRLS